MTTSRNIAILEDDLKVKQLSLIRMTCTSFVYLSVRCSHHTYRCVTKRKLQSAAKAQSVWAFASLVEGWLFESGRDRPNSLKEVMISLLPNPRQLVGMKRVLGVKDIYKWMFYATVGAIRQRIFAARRL